MSGIFRRCGCRAADGRTYGTLPVKDATDKQRARACPKMLTDKKHGTFSWRLSLGFDPATGKRVQVNGGTFTTLREAQVALNAARAKKDLGALARPTQETLATYGPNWLERRRTTGQHPLAATTVRNYRAYLEHDIVPSRLGKLKLTDIRRSDVVAFVDGLAKAGRGATTIARILATVQSILTGAVKDEIIQANVARGVDTPTVVRTERPIWSPAELAAFLETASEHRLGALFELALHAALRRGEVCGLRWTDVDVTRQVMTIRHNRVIGDTIVETKPKTDDSASEVELSPAAVATLAGWRLRQDTEREESGDAWCGQGHVFTREDGSPLDPKTVTELFAQLATKTEEAMLTRQREELVAQGLTEAEADTAMAREPVCLPRATLHSLRHFAASYMWASTGDILAVSKALRHASPATTSAVYAHMRKGAQRAMFGTIADTLKTANVHTMHTHEAAGAQEKAPARTRFPD